MIRQFFQRMLVALRTVTRRFATATSCLPHVNCWKCQKLLDCEREKFFCGSCHLIQPPVKCVNYFQYLGLPVSFELDMSSLATYFKNLQRQLHPDRFSNRSDDEQNFSAQQSSMVNKAFSTLANPLSRALYLLKMHGKPVGESEDQPTNLEFLGKMMELNERLVDCKSMEQIKKMADETKETLDRSKKELSGAFRAKDIDKAKDIVIRMKFYVSLGEKINAKLGLG